MPATCRYIELGDMGVPPHILHVVMTIGAKLMDRHRLMDKIDRAKV